jgi:hypothetical protein
MNKATNRRALAVFLVICLLYVSVAFRIPEKLSMKRIAVRSHGPSHGMNLQGSLEPNRAEARTQEIVGERGAGSAPASASVPEASPASIAAPARTLPNSDSPKASDSASRVIAAKGGSWVEPRFLISIPITCYAIREGWIDRESLIFARKDGQNSVWLKPLDILKQQDESGIRHLFTIIGKNRIKEFLRKEAVDIREDLSPEDMMLGRGYVIEKKKLLSLYDRFVPEECNDLFPLALAQGGVLRGRGGFQFVSSTDAAKMRAAKEDEEWRMPNLTGLTIKLAIDNLAGHTARIKVHGSGVVVDQYPKPFERLNGDSECAIYGRLASE